MHLCKKGTARDCFYSVKHKSKKYKSHRVWSLEHWHRRCTSLSSVHFLIWIMKHYAIQALISRKLIDNEDFLDSSQTALINYWLLKLKTFGRTFEHNNVCHVCQIRQSVVNYTHFWNFTLVIPVNFPSLSFTSSPGRVVVRWNPSQSQCEHWHSYSGRYTLSVPLLPLQH